MYRVSQYGSNYSSHIHLLIRVCYKWLSRSDGEGWKPCQAERWICRGTNRNQLEVLQEHIWIILPTINTYQPSHLVFLFLHSLSRHPPFSAVFCYRALKILHVICQNISILFVCNIFFCFSVSTSCLRSINHLIICSTNSHFGLHSQRHYVSLIISLLLFLIITINGYIPRI